MRRFCLATFRGPDARSLARALACLLIFSGWLGALHAGSMAVAAAGSTVVCSANGTVPVDGRDPAKPAGKEHRICCLVGCTTAVAGIGTSAVARLEFDPPAHSAGKVDRDVAGVPVVRPALAGPRGPPFLA